MLINRNTYGYSNNKNYIVGRGFLDSLSTVFNSMKASAIPVFKNVGSYVSANRDLIAKPVLGALGSLAATGLTAGVPSLIKHIVDRNKSRVNPQLQLVESTTVPEDAKYKEILRDIMEPPQTTPVTNIIGSGVSRQRKKRGAGIKTF